MGGMTIGEASARLGVSARTLRYYEQLGLIRSARREPSDYRAYGEADLLRLGRIVALRKLRIPLREIARILSSERAAEAIEAFERALSEVRGEIDALSAIRRAIEALIARLRAGGEAFALPDGEGIARAAEALAPRYKEEGPTMEELNKAEDRLGKLRDEDVRIVYLPPSRVASSHYVGDEPEHHAATVMDDFVRSSGLAELKPDLRSYGFNHPNPGCIEGSDGHGYEFWVTISEDLEVPAPLTAKRFEGGLYAAVMIPMGAFEVWGKLWEWAHDNERFEPNLIDDGGQCMNGLLEECLNYRNRVADIRDGDYGGTQLDLLLPVKPKAKPAEEA